MKILITGGTGFVGKNIIKNFQSKRYKIFLIQRKKKNKNKINHSINCDLRDKNKLIKIMDIIKPNIVIGQGDTTTAFSAALAAFYLKIPVGHVEAGLRTFNIYSPFPEELNRQITARIAKFNCFHD